MMSTLRMKKVSPEKSEAVQPTFKIVGILSTGVTFRGRRRSTTPGVPGIAYFRGLDKAPYSLLNSYSKCARLFSFGGYDVPDEQRPGNTQF